MYEAQDSTPATTKRQKIQWDLDLKLKHYINLGVSKLKNKQTMVS
jgi:hypothetical protein